MEKNTQFNLWYAIIAMIGVMWLQNLWTQSQRIEPIPYSRFEQYLAEGKIDKVLIGSQTIQGTMKEAQDGGRTGFVTTRVEPDLADKLKGSGVEFAGAVKSTFIRDLLSWVVPDLIAYRRFNQPFLGVVADMDVNRVVTERIGVQGALMLAVQPNASGEAAGLRGSVTARDGSIMPGDVIQAINGEPVKSVADLPPVPGEREVGDWVRVDDLRKGGPVTLEALLERVSA